MGTIIPPALFGIDPDETWDYIPEKARELPDDMKPVFILSAPDAALDQEMEMEESKVRKAVLSAFPSEEYAEIGALDKIPAKERTEEQVARHRELNHKWLLKWLEESNKVDSLPLMRKAFAKCVRGWKNVRTPRKALDFPSDPAKVVDMLSRELRTELFLAIKTGMEVTPEEKASLT